MEYPGLGESPGGFLGQKAKTTLVYGCREHEGKQVNLSYEIPVAKGPSVPLFNAESVNECCEATRVCNALYAKVMTGEGAAKAVKKGIFTPKWEVENHGCMAFLMTHKGASTEIDRRVIVNPNWEVWGEWAYFEVDGTGLPSLGFDYEICELTLPPKGRFNALLKGVGSWTPNRVTYTVGTTTSAVLVKNGEEIEHDVTTKKGHCGSGLFCGDRCVGIHYLGNDQTPNRAIAVTAEFLSHFLG